MAYRIEKERTGGTSIVIDGLENGISASPYSGIANIRNLNTGYYPGVAYVNYRRQSSTLTNSSLFYAGIHSVNVSNNLGWIFAAPASPVTMGNPTGKATSPVGLNYILDSTGQIWKQNSVNSSGFSALGNGGRIGNGSGGLAYWNNYLVVFGDGFIEFCGDGTGDSTIISGNWNLANSGPAQNTNVITTNYASFPNNITTTTALNGLPKFQINDPVQFTTTGTLPAPLALNTTYYILTIGTSFVTISASVGGLAIILTSDGSGTNTITDTANPLPLGNMTNSIFSAAVGSTAMTILSYVNQLGQTVTANWLEATGTYNIIMQDGTKMLAAFTNGSASVTLEQPLVYIAYGAGWQIQLIDTSVTDYRPYVSKVDGNIYFCNGRNVGRILSENTNIKFNPGLAITYVVDVAVVELLDPNDSVVDITDLQSTQIIAGNKSIYTWNYVSANVSVPSPVAEQISRIVNLLNNIIILAGTKGNIYVYNGYSAQLFYKIADFIAGAIDPVWSYGDLMVHRSKLFFQALAQNTSGTNLLAGIFSLVASPSLMGEAAKGFVMENQNSYGLTPAAGALASGVLIDNEKYSTGIDSYYSAWSNGASTGGINYNDATLWQNFEPIIETDIIPIGNILDKTTDGQIQFKLDRPMASGDQIKLFWRPSLSDSYTQIGPTFTNQQLSDYAPSNVTQSQWAQFMIQFKCASSGSSFIPFRELRIQIT